MKKERIRIKKSEENPESTELLASSIIKVSNAADKLLKGGITRRAIAILLQDGIGATKITKSQIHLVLDNLPRLKAWYCK